MRIGVGMAAVACLALAGCGKSGDAGGNAAAGASGGNSSASASAPAAGSGAKLRPGLYETVTETAVSGLPPALAKAMVPTKKTGRTCVTAEEASRPNGDLFGGEKQKGCTYKDNVFAGGIIRGSMVCAGQNGQGKATMAIDGSYGGDSFDVRTHMTTSVAGNNMTMEGRTIAHRIGDCKGDEDES